MRHWSRQIHPCCPINCSTASISQPRALFSAWQVHAFRMTLVPIGIHYRNDVFFRSGRIVLEQTDRCTGRLVSAMLIEFCKFYACFRCNYRKLSGWLIPHGLTSHRHVQSHLHINIYIYDSGNFHKLFDFGTECFESLIVLLLLYEYRNIVELA